MIRGISLRSGFSLQQPKYGLFLHNAVVGIMRDRFLMD